ncbi:hypothetical protein BBF96_11765 [Anoxybacter fermentans]|uniref:Phosphotyrosine protein phosphatase I domain-containing protein n=2 Tax=Anoxybacter fermentans TaxID=1323375 RepID=A0A3S9T300_9FIRM|nr:hypothetical protein BBF96_11765 [Anoxybacter fermentans]
MAEYLFRHLAEEAGRGDEFIVRSAGVAAIENDPAADQAIEVLGDKGITAIQKHKATPINEELVQDADLILTMTQAHKKMLLDLYPDAKEKVFTLKEYTIRPEEESNLDIADPFGQPVEVYQKCAGELEIYLKRLLEQL